MVRSNCAKYHVRRLQHNRQSIIPTCDFETKLDKSFIGVIDCAQRNIFFATGFHFSSELFTGWSTIECSLKRGLEIMQSQMNIANAIVLFFKSFRLNMDSGTNNSFMWVGLYTTTHILKLFYPKRCHACQQLAKPFY